MLQTNFTVQVSLFTLGKIVDLCQEFLAFLSFVISAPRIVASRGRCKCLQELRPALVDMCRMGFNAVFVPLLQLSRCWSQAKEVEA